ncbi:hypothetical protein [Hyphomicrobium sp. DMF-1]|uniref:hypothetical protein n=1 Tax=Hyphomicrobium sp. DMF-1 TaxID=3019544 RepID=UPI0022EBFDBC|nr:hypothetical protein [Hyphomicrobium sp. DMF-1]WBT40167.1 hypothetical protein PE058_09875 [Hyphomicrobium sp. DMF-1]
MRVTLLGKGSNGVVSIFTGDDDLPFSDPLSHLDRIKFHSSLAYPKVIRTETKNQVFDAYATSLMGTFTKTYDLFAHGRPGQPWVLASATIGGNKIAFTGSLPVQMGFSGSTQTQWARWVTIGADATHVRAFEYVVKTNSTSMPAITIPITVWVTDELL